MVGHDDHLECLGDGRNVLEKLGWPDFALVGSQLNVSGVVRVSRDSAAKYFIWCN